MHALRDKCLSQTQLRNTTVGGIRTKLLKLGAIITFRTRRILIEISSSCPYKHIFAIAYRRLQIATNTTLSLVLLTIPFTLFISFSGLVLLSLMLSCFYFIPRIFIFYYVDINVIINSSFSSYLYVIYIKIMCELLMYQKKYL